MHKTAESTPVTQTPKSRNPKSGQPKKKTSSNKTVGQKWFKGTPKSRSSKKLLKSSPVDKTPQKPPTPAGYVEFELDGICEKFSIYEAIICGTFDEFEHEGFPKCNLFGTPEPPEEASDAVSTGKLKSTKKTTDGFRKGKTPKSGKNKTKTPETETKKKIDKVCKLPEANYEIISNYNTSEAPPLPIGYIRYMETSQEDLADEVEYDLDGEDNAWLQFVNDKRKHLNVAPVKFADMEFLMDRLEKESYFQMQSTGGIDQGSLIDDDAVCCICMDGECQNSNAILFCDMCNLAVHQECYGVPYIPEGQWLCRRCLQSPSRAVDCALCPNKGGAFKQTDDGRWAHVVCAIWIPEVCFANTVFLEPVDSIGNIPPARWRLVCFICKQKGVGACIQCHKGNCYTAFHVTCAQQAGLCMKMDTVKDSTSVQVKKTAYCDNHAPPDSDFAKDGEGAPSPRQKMKQARKVLAEKRSAVPVLSIPTIPEERITEISQMVAFPRKNQFIKRLMAYWKLKRQSRNGVPLLRRLQASSSVPHPKREGHGSAESKTEESQVLYRYWLRLRQDLERARLLCELVRKREKVKKELIHLKCREMDVRLRPFSMFLLNVLDEISSKDVQGFFQEPVDVHEVPDYLDVVTCPMDFSRMKEKVVSFEYNNLDEFETDFQLMIENCLSYNAKDTVFYRAALRLRELGGIILRHARRSVDAIGFDSQTGLHLPERNHHQSVMSDDEIIRKVESFLNDPSRFSKPFDEHINLLNEILDDTLNLNHPVTRKKKFGRVKQEIVRVRRLKHSKGKLSSTSHLKEKYKIRESRSDSMEDTDSGTRKTRLRGSLGQSSTVDLDRRATQERRSQRGSKRKADIVDEDDSPPPSPPVLRNSTVTSPRKDELDATPAKRSRRLSIVDKDVEKPSDMKLRSSVSSNAIIGGASSTVDSACKTRTSRSTPRMESPNSSRKGTVLNSPKLIMASTTLKSSPNCRKRVFSTTPVKSAATPKKSRSPSQRQISDIQENEVEEEMEVEVPRLRNSTRTKKMANNAMTINNNLISCRNATWPGKNVFNESSGNKQKLLLHQSSWSSPSKSKLNSTSSGNENEEESSSPRSKKKLGGIFTDIVKVESPSASDIDRKNLSTPNCTVGSTAKPDNFSVYRSAAHDADLNSDDEDDKDGDDDANANSDTEESSESEEDSADEAEDRESECTENSQDEASEVSDNEAETNPTTNEEEVSDGEVLPVRHSNSESHRTTRCETSSQSCKPDARKMNRAINFMNLSNSNDVPDNNSYREDSEAADSPSSVDGDGTPSLRSLDTVWAKIQEEWYPAMIIDPEVPNGDVPSGLAIPAPPEDVLSCKPRGTQVQYLVLTFENKGAWKWISQSHLEPLGQDPTIDQCHLHNPDLDKRAQGALRKVFEKAIRQRNRWNGAN